MLTVDPTMPSVISSEIGSSAGPGFCAQLPRPSACCNWKHFSSPSSSLVTMPPLRNTLPPPLKTRTHTSSCCACLFKMTLRPSQSLLSGTRMSLLSIYEANFYSLSWPRGCLLSLLCDLHVPLPCNQRTVFWKLKCVSLPQRGEEHGMRKKGGGDSEMSPT